MFIELDNFCNALYAWQKSTGRYRRRTRVASLCDSELMSICVFPAVGCVRTANSTSTSKVH
jgi:hypothetical protein